ncbi:hypothetical protein SAMN04488490_2847 [Marinobacter sp. LV10R510-11A]|uniref:hypothetical protein n=1 Tax=Marinobacter sp. LV10R510-11A TaxID=1415568 RepID=UPI000BB8B707|nr:hypothetical protein [Marinobacter sp. LV10R510-11A]SOB77085.1 hypothetical protein SAMN04488490_2847 [Marinobacter sp. LV10R510-11A]
MKYIGRTALIILLSLSEIACASQDLNVLVPVEARAATSGITINRTAHPIMLPLGTLAGATFIGSEGELIVYEGNKGLYASVVTQEDWGTTLADFHRVPEYVFKRDLASIHDPEFRKELEGIILITLEPAVEKVLSVMTIGKITAYIAFNPEKSIIMLSSPDKPDLFTRLVLNRFSWEEIENEILKGIKEH